MEFLKYIHIAPERVIGLIVFVAALLWFIIWVAGFRKHTRPIIQSRNYFFILSAVLLALSFYAIFFTQPNWGLDFTGGTVINMAVKPDVNAPQISEAITKFAATTGNPDLYKDPRIQLSMEVMNRDEKAGTMSTETAPETTPAVTPGAPPVATPVTPPAATPVTTPIASPAGSPAAVPAGTPITSPVVSPVATPGAVTSPVTTPVTVPAVPTATTPAATPASPAVTPTGSPAGAPPDTTGGTAESTMPASGIKLAQFRQAIIQIKEVPTDQANALAAFLQKELGGAELLKIETIGPTVGGELKNRALLAVIIALLAQLLYISFRFGTQFRYGFAADIALIHDLITMIGMYILLKGPIDSPFVAAILTIIGYSVMDTVVVFDRIRENLKLMKGANYEEIVNLSLNQVITRTSVTSFTTVLTAFALFYFGGETLRNFALALLIGLIMGTYSSFFVASPLVVLIDNWTKSRDQKRVAERRAKLESEAAERSKKRLVASEPTVSETLEQAVSGEPSEAPPSREKTRGGRKRRR